MYLGSLYVNSFNEFGRHWQVTIQAEGEFRNRRRGHQPAPGPQQVGADGAAGHAGRRCARSAARSASRATTCTPPPPITGNLQPGVSSGEAIDDDRQRSRPRRCRCRMKTEWTELMFMQIRAGNTAIYVFALAVVCVFLALAALYESWTLPLAVILVVPLCLLCSVAGVLLHEPRRQHLRADRPGGAGRAGVQERDPDRRVRQAAARGGPVASSRRRWRRRGCGCGRS